MWFQDQGSISKVLSQLPFHTFINFTHIRMQRYFESLFGQNLLKTHTKLLRKNMVKHFGRSCKGGSALCLSLKVLSQLPFHTFINFRHIRMQRYFHSLLGQNLLKTHTKLLQKTWLSTLVFVEDTSE